MDLEDEGSNEGGNSEEDGGFGGQVRGTVGLVGGGCNGGSGSGASGSGGAAGISVTSSDINGSDGSLDTVGADTVLVVDGAGSGEGALVGLALGLAARVEASDEVVAGARTGGSLGEGMVSTVVVGPADGVTGGDVELLRREETVDDVDVPGLGSKSGGNEEGCDGESGGLHDCYVLCVVGGGGVERVRVRGRWKRLVVE